MRVMFYNNVTKVKLFCEVLKFITGILYISSRKHCITEQHNEKERLEREVKHCLFDEP